MKPVEWHPAAELPKSENRFIEEILIEYQNDIGTFHAIGLFRDPQDGRPPAFIEVLTGTAFDWKKTVVRWHWYT